MTENLRLEFDGNTTYDSTTTNIATGTTITPSATQARTVAPTVAEVEEWKNSNYTDPTDADLNRWLSRGTQGERESDNTTGDKTGENQLLGVYYNWYTATAGSGVHATVMSEVAYSICPSGWKLPSGPNNGYDYYSLIVDTYQIIQTPGDQETDVANRILNGIPFSLPFSGRVLASNGRTSNRGQFTNLWTKAAVESHSAYNLSLAVYSVYTVEPSRAAVKGRGDNIRCVAQ